MSAIDWASNTVEAFATQPPRQAATTAAVQFTSGVNDRVRYAKHRITPTPVYSTTLLGRDLTLMATSIEDIKRVRTLNGERPIAKWLARGVTDGTVFWDVGAYHGHYSVLMADYGAHVVAVEPSENNIPRVRMNGALNGHSIPVYSIALSDSNEERVFGGPKESENAVGGLNDPHTYRGNGVSPIQVNCTTVATRRGEEITPAPEVLKIDVEGHELAVLDGMGDHLEGVERVAIEVHSDGDVPRVEEVLQNADLQPVEVDTTRSQTYVGGIR